MSDPTGCVWHNPDDFEKVRRGEKGRLANPQNIAHDDFQGMRRVLYGKAVTDSAPASPSVHQAVPVAEQLAQSRDLSLVVAPNLVAAEPGRRSTPVETVAKTLVAIGSFGRMLDSSSETAKTSARLALSAIADAEYARDGGPRKMVVDKLRPLGLVQETPEPADG